MTALKKTIHQKYMDLIDQNIAIHQKSMNDAQDAANKEQRSTAGDKYDTSRAMSQNERDMFARQLAESIHMKKVLTSIDPSKVSTKISGGSLVKTSLGNYYLSVSCGKLAHDGIDYIAISPLTPIGQVMLDKVKGESFKMRNEETFIQEVE